MNNFYKTIFLNYFKEMASPILNENEYPYILKHYIKDISLSQLHKHLINNDYFLSSSIHDVLKTLRVKDLKIILEKNNIKSTGRRKTNMALLDKLSENEISKYLPNNYKDYYSVSNKGVDYINNNYDFTLILKYYTLKVDVNKYISYRTNNHSFFDTYEKMLVDYLKESKKLKSSYSQKIVYEKFAHLYDIYSYHENSLYCALANLYIECSADSIMPTLEFANFNFFNPISLNKKKREILSEFNFYVSPQSDIIKIIYDNREYFDPRMIDEVYKIKLSLNVCSKEYFKIIIYDIFDNKFSYEEVAGYIKNEVRKLKIINK